MNEDYVLDACSLIAFLNDEEGAARVETVIRAAETQQSRVHMNRVNLLEVYYHVYRAEGRPQADHVMQSLRELPIHVIACLEDQVFDEAGRLKATYRVSLADAIALAEAKTRNATLVTADHHELDVVDEKEDLDFQWIR